MWKWARLFAFIAVQVQAAVTLIEPLRDGSSYLKANFDQLTYYDLKQSKSVELLTLKEGDFSEVRVSPKEDQVALGVQLKGSIDLYVVPFKGNKAIPLEDKLKRNAIASSFIFSPDGKLLYYFNEKGLQSLNLETKKDTLVFPHDALAIHAQSLQISPDGKQVVWTDFGCKLNVLDFKDLKLKRIEARANGWSSPRYSPNGKYLAVIEAWTDLHLYSVETKELIAKGNKPLASSNSIDFWEEHNLIVSLDDNGTSRFWDVPSLLQVHEKMLGTDHPQINRRLGRSTWLLSSTQHSEIAPLNLENVLELQFQIKNGELAGKEWEKAWQQLGSLKLEEFLFARALFTKHAQGKEKLQNFSKREPPKADLKQVDKLLELLGHDDFDTRVDAMEKLQEMLPQAGVETRLLEYPGEDPEILYRLRKIVGEERLETRISSEKLRQMRSAELK